MGTDTKYYGWTNHATWDMGIHLDSEYDTYRYIIDVLIPRANGDADTLATYLQDLGRTQFPHLTRDGVNWREIAEGYVEDGY